MQIVVQYTGPLAEITGRKCQSIDLPDGARLLDLLPHLGEYYALRGWDSRGVPTPGRLADLGLALPDAAGPDPRRP